MTRLNLQQFASSADYWRKREEQNLKSNLKQEAEYDKEIERIYKDMLDAAQKEIDAFFGKYADAEGITLAEAKKRVSQLDIEAYERKAKKYVDAASKGKDGVAFSKQANEEMRLYNLTMKVNRLEMLKANIGLELIKGHAELETFMSEILKGRTEAELKRQAGILGETIIGNAKLADTIVNASFKNATFSDRIWMYHDQMKADLSKLLQSGMIQGKNSRQLAKDLRKYYYGPEYLKNGKKGAVYNTERLMRTELARVQTEAQKQAYIKEGTEEYKFMALGDACDICMAINGKSFKVKDMMPGENAPPLHPHCRCTTVSDDSKGREELDALLDFVSKGGTEADWNRLKSIEKSLVNGIISVGGRGQAPSSKRIPTLAKLSEIIREAIASDKPVYAQNLREAYIKYGVQKRGDLYDVCIHGAPFYVEYEEMYRFNAQVLGWIVSGRKDYHADDIRLMSCNTGCADEKGNCLAQQLANQLKVDVYAPIGTLNINPDGSLTVEAIIDGKLVILNEEEGFKKFSPK